MNTYIRLKYAYIEKGGIRMRKKIIAFITAFFMACMMNFTYVFAQTDDQLFEYVKYLIKSYYAEEVDDVLNATSIEEMINRLGDPYTSYMTADEYQALINSIDMEFVGIGVSVEKVPEGVLILSVFNGSGAEEAGLKPGDIILYANGVSLKDLDLSIATTYIRGEEGTSVQLTVRRGDSVFSVSVLRKKIALPTVEWELIDKVGYVKIWSFGENTTEQFKKAVKELRDRGAKGLILDIRENGGGYLKSGVDMAAYFSGGLPSTLVYTKNEGWYYLLGHADQQIDIPTLVLVDGYTASASELFAGALQDYGRAYLLGSDTFGKGSIQSLFPLNNGSVLKLTVGYFYTPKGRQIHNVGLKPDLKIDDEFLLDAALLLLSGNAENSTSKKGFTAIKINEDILDMDLSEIQTDEHWETYRHIVERALSQGKQLYVGTDKGWQEICEFELHKLYFPYYDEVPILSDIRPDKEFTVTFSKPVNVDEVKEKIQLIDAKTGERVSCSFYQMSDMQVKVVPDELLQNGREYYLVIQEGINSRNGVYLKQGVLCRAIVTR